MSRNIHLHQTAHRSKSPSNEPVRKVTIQQKVVQPPSTSVATTDHSDRVRRYPNVAYHDPSGRGHRGKHWAKSTRGVVAGIVNNLESGKRRTRDDTVGTGTEVPEGGSQKTRERVSSSVPRAGERETSINDEVKYSFGDDVERERNVESKIGVAETLPRLESKETATVRPGASVFNAEQTNEREISRHAHSTTEQNTSKNMRETGARLPVVAPKPKKTTSEKKLATSTKIESSTKHEPSVKFEPSTKLKPSMKLEISTKTGNVKTEERTSNNASWVEQKELWEKAVKELELVISNKELVIDNLSKVNRKLSEDIDYYEGSLEDYEDRLRIAKDEHRITGDIQGYQRIIKEREEKIRKLEDQDQLRVTGDMEGYQKIIEERDERIRELECKLHEMRQLGERRSSNSLELSHGSQNVLKTLGMKREKVELQKKVEELEEQLKISQNQANLQETKNADSKTFQEIPLLLYKFRDGIETKLQENAEVVSALEQKLINCLQNCNKLTKLNKNKTPQKRVIECQITQEVQSQQVQTIPDLEENNSQTRHKEITSEDATLGDRSLGELSAYNLKPAEVSSYVENLTILQEELKKERMINEDFMERLLELEDLNNEYRDTIKALEGTVRGADNLRAQNESLLGEILQLKENSLQNTSEQKDIHGFEGKDKETLGLPRRDEDTLGSYRDQVSSLQSTLDSQKGEINELREKIVEDEELIEELRANYQREEKWNREMQRSYEWELSTSASKDDRIEEFQDYLWAREKLVRELQQQLEFEDKRCEELLEKLIASQKEADDFQEMCKDLRKKVEDKETQIKEFCDQNDRDAVTIGNLTSENKQLRLDVENVTKAKRVLEEDLERVNGCLEAVEADKENFVTRQKTKVKNLSGQLEDKEFTSKGKDEVIEKLQEDVVLLSADVQEMEYKMEEGRLTLEEDLKKARDDILERDKNLEEALEKYKELQEVCKCLRETISEKEGDVLDREAVMAHQREIIEGHEKEIEGLRRICGDNSTPLNDKPELVYTESEMEEVTDFLEQERTLSEIQRKQVSSLEEEIEDVKEKCKKTTVAHEEQAKTLTAARDEIQEYENKLKETKEDLNNTNRELSKLKDELTSSEKELEEFKTSTTILQVDLTELNTKNELLEAIQESTGNELTAEKQKLEKLHTEMEELKFKIKQQNVSSTSQGINTELESENDKMKLDINDLNLINANEQNENEIKEQPESDVKNELEELCWAENSKEDGKIEQQVEKKLESETCVLDIELNELKQERKQLQDENSEVKHSLKDLQTLYETVSFKNSELQSNVGKVTDKWLKSEEKLRQAQVTNVNLRYTLDEYVSQSRDQIRHLKNHEREVATLTEHIHEMDALIQGFKLSLQEVVENGKNDKNSENNTHLKESGTQKEPCGTPLTTNNTEEASSPQGLNYSTDVDSSATPTVSAPLQNADSRHDDLGNMTTNSQSRFKFLTTVYAKILTAKIPKNVILILIFLFLVFCLGCTNNSVISRKYLFVFANSFITLVFFALWVNEIHKHKKYKTMIFGENLNFQTTENHLKNDGYQPPEGILQCENCGSKISIQDEEFHRHAKIKSSFQELHEKFLEAIENSSKNTLPIQELYEKYEKLKDDLEDMRKERLQKDTTNSVLEIDEVSTNDYFLAPKWNKAATILGKALVITLLCEVLYIRGIYFLPHVANLVSFLLSLITFSYFYETNSVDDTTRERLCATQRETELGREIDELNLIIDKEHDLVMTQRDAIKALEKRLRKEFEKRIKQRNILLKKLKYKGKLEDLRELLDNGYNDEQKGTRKTRSNYREVPPQGIDMDINSNNNQVMDGKTEHTDNNGAVKMQRGINADTSGLNMDNLHWGTDEYMKLNENIEEVHERVNQVTTQEHNITKKLQEIVTDAKKQSLDLKFIFSPMFFFLGLPLTAILLSCRYITIPVLMMAVQGAIFLKETKFIEVEALPKVLRKDINPIVLDSIIVLYACFLAVFLQCTQSIVVMITCAIVQLAVHWWTSYRLAKKGDTLEEITMNCLPSTKKQDETKL